MPNKFELVLLAASAITLDRENDKNAVIALRESAAKTIQAGDVREGPIHSMLHNAEVNESEAAVVPTLPRALRQVLERENQSTDTVVDVMTEEQLLKGMEKLVPMEPSISGWGGSSDMGSQDVSPIAGQKEASEGC